MATESMSLEERLSALVEPLKEEQEQLYASNREIHRNWQNEVANLTAQKDEAMGAIQKDLDKIAAVLKALEGEKPKPARKPRTSNVSPIGQRRRNGTATGCGISAEAVKPFVDHMKTVVAEKTEKGEEPTFTQQEIYRPMGADQAKGSAAFRFLRQIEFLRKQGRTRTQADLYMIMDSNAYDRVMELIEKQVASAA